MSWRKEKHEHPWASTATAKRIARDHTAKKHQAKPTRKTPLDSGAAKRDLAGFIGGGKRIIETGRKEGR